MSKVIAITGSQGFIGSNLVHHLVHLSGYSVLEINRNSSRVDFKEALTACDVVVHLAGANRPIDESWYQRDNVEFTRELIRELESQGPKPVIFASSTHAESDTSYGRSKKAAENELMSYASATGRRVEILRLPNVFGKWCKPNYNSVVATFIYNAIREIPLDIRNPNKVLELLYIDDLVATIINLIDSRGRSNEGKSISVFRISVGSLAEQILRIHRARLDGRVLDVGVGLMRGLYATYLSALTPDLFEYPLKTKSDSRGMFVEIVKTSSSGQFSFFTSKKGVTRGSHFHHTKAEKFVVVQGAARFRFKNIRDGQMYETVVTALKPVVVESVPGWVHDILNIGEDELVIAVWSSEVFEENRPDTTPKLVRDEPS